MVCTGHSEPGECDSLNCYTTDAKSGVLVIRLWLYWSQLRPRFANRSIAGSRRRLLPWKRGMKSATMLGKGGFRVSLSAGFVDNIQVLKNRTFVHSTCCDHFFWKAVVQWLLHPVFPSFVLSSKDEWVQCSVRMAPSHLPWSCLAKEATVDQAANQCSKVVLLATVEIDKILLSSAWIHCRIFSRFVAEFCPFTYCYVERTPGVCPQ